jgi:hypothetical protein
MLYGPRIVSFGFQISFGFERTGCFGLLWLPFLWIHRGFKSRPQVTLKTPTVQICLSRVFAVWPKHALGLRVKWLSIRKGGFIYE